MEQNERNEFEEIYITAGHRYVIRRIPRAPDWTKEQTELAHRSLIIGSWAVGVLLGLFIYTIIYILGGTI